MRIAVVLFLFALALRLLFWFATADSTWAWHVGFQGDAPLWQQLAAKIANGQSDELLLLPLRPPGMQWLVSLLWDGDPAGAFWPRLFIAVLGATIAPMVWLLLRRHLATSTAVLAGGLCAASSNLLLLSSGLHSELPYLVLFLSTLFLQERLQAGSAAWLAVLFGAMHAAACLLRAEHVLTFVPLLALPLWLGATQGRRNTALAAATFLLCLVPWHVIAWSQVDSYNTANTPNLPPAGLAAPGMLPWDEPALAAIRQLPGFQQGPVYGFVTDTVRVRGGTSVRAADLDIVRDAYCCWPLQLPRPFICLYGGLNFFLGNSREADGGFSQRALDRAPPLTGGDGRYPPGLRQVLPRDGTLALSYPPHLDLLLHGYRHGLDELWDDPLGGLARIGKKLWHGAEGATGGLGGLGLPIGLSGERRAVDMVTPTGMWPIAFRLIWLGVAVAGLCTLRRERFLLPWLVFGATKLIVLTAFFGYARQGALLVPLVSIGIAAAWHRWLLPRWPGSAHAGVGGLLLAALMAVEGMRCLGIEARVDGVPLSANPTPRSIEHGAHRIDFSWN